MGYRISVVAVTIGFVVLFAALQSVAGVGLLLFGTPALALIGYSYFETLAIVVPASLLVSLLQLAEAPAQVLRRAPIFAALTAPLTIVGLVGVFALGIEANVAWLLAGGLSGALILQLYNFARPQGLVFVARFDWLTLGGIGLIHGLTNLGGGFLAAYASFKGSSKIEIRGLISMGYVIFAVVQIGTLLVIDPGVFSSLTGFAMVAAVSTYVILGRTLFRKIPERGFRLLMPVITGFFLLALVFSELRIA